MEQSIVMGFNMKGLYPEIRVHVDTEYGSNFPKVEYYYRILDPWRFYNLPDGIFVSSTYRDYPNIIEECIHHCNQLINMYENGHNNN